MTTPRPDPLLKRSRSSPSSICSVMSHGDELSVLPSITHPPSKRVQVQQSLLVLIHLNFLRRVLKRTFEDNHGQTKPQLNDLRRVLPTFFGQVGYVSNHFLDSSFQAIKVYFEVHTFHANLHDIPKLTSLASFVGADLQSVFLYTYGSLKIEKFLNYSCIITGLRIELREPSDLEFLNKSSSLFTRLKQLEVKVFQRISVSMLLIEALKTNTTVTSVDLEGISIGAEATSALAEVLKVNTSVTSVYLCGNFLNNECIRALAEGLKVNDSVTTVYLRGNSIGAEGARALAEALKVNASVTSVDLGGNSVRDEGVRALAEALKVNDSVTSVDLGGNSIKDDGVRALAEALKVNSSVTSVDLRFNSIRDEGVRALAEALKVNVSVTSVGLGGNSIGDEGARALAEALQVNSSITSLDLGHNSVQAEGARALAEALKVNVSVTSVDLRGNSIRDEGATALEDALKVNTKVDLQYSHQALYDSSSDDAIGYDYSDATYSDSDDD
ncbi:hypothetical protein GEMRC1_005218 [Eukaryota sp. GEM-RC1]